MALLQQTRILSNQRVDLPDYRNIESFVCADFKAIHKNMWTGENFVMSGFNASGIGTTDLEIVLAGSVAIYGQDDGGLYIGAPSLAALVTDALTPASTNYVELSIVQDTGGADSRAFWDPTANGGEGGEFSQIIDTYIFNSVKLEINTSSFTGAADNIAICEVDVNGAGIITAIRDARNMFWRLGRASDPTFTFPWVSRVEPPNTQFTGADKDIKNLKEWADAIMDSIREIKGTTYWFEAAGPSIIGSFRNMGLSYITSASTDSKWTWDGSVLKLTDSSGTPANSDAIAWLRLFDSVADLKLTRQDGTGGSTSFALANGEVLWVELPDPLANVNYSGTGLTASNFRISARGSVPNNDTTFWLAFREGNNVFLRFQGELEPGEESEISDNINENILAAIGIALETDMPNYGSNNYVTDGDSLVQAVSDLDAQAGVTATNAAQDRSMKVIEGGTWSVNLAGDTLTWSADAFIDVPEVTRVSNRILAGNVTLPNANSVAYVEINRASGPATLTVNVADVDALTPTPNTVIIARRVTAGILVGQHSFLLKADERLELDGALAEINRLLGQLRIKPHETDLNKVRISAADVTLLDGSTLSQIIGDFLLKFDGAVINFTTGQVFEADGSTPLGNDFTPFTIPVGQYFWYGISLLPDAITGDNKQLATVQVDLATSANASASAALKPVISGDIKLGAVQVRNNAGNIERNDIVKLGVGSGSGSGSGAGSARDFYEDRLNFSLFELVSATAFREDKETYLDLVNSTGAYSPADRAFKFSAIGQILRDLNNATDTDFLASELDITETELYVRWKEGFVDPAATYEVSRDGSDWQAVTMERVGSTNAFRGYHRFEDEPANLNLDSQGTPDATSELTNTGSGQARAIQFTPASARVMKQVALEMNKVGSPAGTFKIKVIKGGVSTPSTSVLDIVSESATLNVADVSAGNSTLTVDMPKAVLLSGQKYWIVIETDSAYKASFVTSTTALGIRVDSSAPSLTGAEYNGTVWAATASEGWAFQLKGRVLQLLTRITSSVADVLIESYGVYYELSPGKAVADGKLEIDEFVFTGDENRTAFPLVNISNPHPDLLEIFDVSRGQVYVAREGVARIDGQTVTFDPDFFDFPGEDIHLVFRQLKAGVIDNSDANANKISTILSQLIDIGDQLESVSDSMVLPKIAVPHTTITNRAQIPDLSMDLKPRLGVERFQAQGFYQIQDEFGPNGEPVFGVSNDKFNQIRLVGNWAAAVLTEGPHPLSVNINDYVEITFYGTGLNLLAINASGRDIRAAVDGGAEGANLFAASGSGIITGRNYSDNTIHPVVNGLTLGIHTVKLRLNAVNFHFEGFEILTENASGLIQLPPGAQLFKGKRLIKSTLTTTPYNSDFETGTLGARGGRVLEYQKADGSVAKAVTPTDAFQLNHPFANHSNEEIARVYNFREFGAGLTNDFSLAISTSNRAFTLDDGTTTLAGSSVAESSVAATRDGLFLNASGARMNFTFVGTGLDILCAADSGTTLDQHTILIDGASIGTFTTGAFSAASNYVVKKIVSGLPYGTHTFSMTRDAFVNSGIAVRNFIVYQPKTPSLPTGAKAIAAYNIMANFAPNSTANESTISTGTLRKACWREFTYVNGTGGTTDWSLPLPTQVVIGGAGERFVAGAIVFSDRLNARFSNTFFGTGFDLRWSEVTTPNRSTDATVSLNGITLNTTNFRINGVGTPTYGDVTVSTYGTGIAFNSATGSLDQRGTGLQNGNGFVVSGLALGRYTLQLNNNVASQYLVVEALDIITPIHSHQNNGPFVLQNTLAVGSQGIEDLRKFSKKDVSQLPNASQAQAITSAPTTTSTAFIPMNDMSVSHYSKTGRIRVNYNVNCSNNTAGQVVQAWVYVNGKAVLNGKTYQPSTNSFASTLSDHILVNVPVGVNKVDVYWNVSAGTGQLLTTQRNMSVEDVE